LRSQNIIGQRDNPAPFEQQPPLGGVAERKTGLPVWRTAQTTERFGNRVLVVAGWQAGFAYHQTKDPDRPATLAPADNWDDNYVALKIMVSLHWLPETCCASRQKGGFAVLLP